MAKRNQLLTIFSFLLILTGDLISLNCYSQDSISKEKVLIIATIKSPAGYPLKNPKYRTIKQDKKISIKRYNNDTVLKGKITSITDSTITIDKQIIKIAEIRKINAGRGKLETIIGLSTFISLSGVAAYREATYRPDYAENGDDLNSWPFFYSQMTIGCLAFTGGIVAIIGGIELITSKYYNLEKNCRLIVGTKRKK